LTSPLARRALLSSLCDSFAPDSARRLLVVAPRRVMPPLASPEHVFLDPTGSADNAMRSLLTGHAAFDVIIIDALGDATRKLSPLDEWLLPGGVLVAVGDAEQAARWRHEAASLRGLLDEPLALPLAGAAALRLVGQVVGLRRVG
jgi:hypothetical protein